MRALLLIIALLLPACVTESPRSLADAIEEATPSIVVVIDERGIIGRCAGVAYSERRIATAKHCIQNLGDAPIVVLVQGSEEAIPVELVGVSEQTDVAVIEVKRATFRPIRIGSAARLRAGDPVVTIGHPMGYLWTVSLGVVSAPKVARGGVDHFQTDAQMFVGNSGGAAVNERGEWVGMTNNIFGMGAPFMTYPVPLRIGFVLPVERVLEAIREIEAR